jgi:hypothetical protein
MRIRGLPEARDDLREAVAYYRHIKPPAIGKLLAERVLAAFKQAVGSVQTMPLSRPEHPDVRQLPVPRVLHDQGSGHRGGRVEYATRDYADRIAKRTAGVK